MEVGSDPLNELKMLGLGKVGYSYRLYATGRRTSDDGRLRDKEWRGDMTDEDSHQQT